MSNLLCSEFARLFKSRVFYVVLALSAGISIYIVVSSCLFYAEITSVPALMDFELTGLFLSHGFIAPVFISLFVGREYGDGTIRNKLAVGHSRTCVYLSEFIVCFTAELIMQAVCLIIVIPSSLVFLDGFRSSAQDIIKNQFIGICIIAVYSAVFVLISMIVNSKAVTVVAALIAAVILFTLGETVSQGLMPAEPYTTEMGEEYHEDDYLEFAESKRGEGLIGIKRTAYLFLDDYLPYCQVLGLMEYSLSEKSTVPPRALRYIVCDLSTFIVINAVGIMVLKRKEFK